MAAQPPAPAAQQPPAYDEPRTICPICAKSFLFPITLPGCGQTLCFTCAKAMAMKFNGSCPFCRDPVYSTLFNRPTQRLDLKMANPDARQVHQNTEPHFWLYSGRNNNGWWRFDPRTEAHIEASFLKGDANNIFIILDRFYELDFVAMTQYLLNPTNNFAIRNIRRVTTAEFDAMEIKGIAGIHKL